jgi:hypothetical protein
MVAITILELLRNWLFWNYYGIGYSGIITELAILELFRNCNSRIRKGRRQVIVLILE